MPYATNPEDGTRIYYEVEGEGPPVALLHALAETNAVWRRNAFIDALLGAGYQLISPDARGHGKSDKPYTSQSHGGITAMAIDVVAVLDELGIERAHIIGYSMGAVTGYALGRDAPDRLKSLILGGGPYGMPEGERADFIEVLHQGPDELVGLLGDLPPDEEAEIRGMDMTAIIAATGAYLTSPIPEHVFASFSSPCLIFVGELDEVHDEVAHVHTLIPQSEHHVLPGLDHVQAAFEMRRVLPQILSFLETVESDRSDEPSGLI